MARDFAPYQTRGRVAAPSAYYIQPGNLHYSNAGEQALAKVKGETGLIIAKGLMDMKEQYETGKVLEANNEYNRLMSEGTAELMQKKQEAALNVVDDYDKLHQKTIEQVQKKYGAFIGFGKAAQAFNVYTERDNTTRRNNMLKYQMDQTEAYRDTQYNNQLATCMEFVGAGGYTDAAIAEGMNRILPLIQSRYGNYGDAKIQEQITSAKRGMVEIALSYAGSMNDYARMKDICNKYRDAISPAKMASTLAAIGKRQQEAQTLNFHERMWEDLGPGATPEQVKTWIKENYQGKQSQGAKNGRSLPLFKQWDENWEDIPFSQGTLGTSGCAPTSMAMALSWAVGKYISPVEVASYATNNGLVASDGVHGADFVPAVAAHYGVEMRQTSDKEEVINLLRQGIPVVAAHDRGMFTDNGHFLVYSGIDADGRVMINDPNGGVRHSDDATFSLDEIFNQESADYYVMDSVPQTDGGDFGAVYDEDFYRMDLAEAEKEGLADYQHRQNMYKAAQNQKIEDYSIAVLDAAMNGGDLSEIQAQLVNEDDRVRVLVQQKIQGVERANARSATRRARGETEPNDAEVTGFFDQKIVYALDHGMMNVDQAREYIFQNEDISNSKKEKLMKMLDRYVLGEKEFAYDWKNIESDVAALLGSKKSEMGALWGLIKKSTLADIREYMHEHDGEAPTQQWVIDTCVQNGMTVEVRNKGNGWFESDEVETTSAAALRDKGVEIQSDNGDGTYNVSILDSQGNPVGTFRISAKDMVEIARSNLPAKDILGFERNRINIEE